jgi:hypothetical protein
MSHPNKNPIYKTIANLESNVAVPIKKRYTATAQQALNNYYVNSKLNTDSPQESIYGSLKRKATNNKALEGKIYTITFYIVK